MDAFNKKLLKDILQEKRRKKYLYIIWIIIALMLLLFLFKDRIIFYLPDKIIYFAEDFTDGTGGCDSLDCTWEKQKDTENGIVRFLGKKLI